MDDSSMFIQWAMETQQEQDAAAAAAGDVFTSSLLELDHSAALQNGTDMETRRYGAMDSWSSGDGSAAVAVENDGWSSNCCTNYPAPSWNFTASLAQPGNNEATATPSPATAPGHCELEPSRRRRSPPSRKSSSASTATMPSVQEHVMAERKRREKINRRFTELSTAIPGLKKMDKATILSDAVRYVKEQQEKLKAFEERVVRTIDSVALVKRPCISNVDGGCQSSGATGGGPPTTRISLPEIEARNSENNVMVRIHCEDGKGVLATLLAEVEGLHLSITHTNVVSFPASTLIINLMAKVDEGFTITADDIVWKLDSALRRNHGGK